MPLRPLTILDAIGWVILTTVILFALLFIADISAYADEAFPVSDYAIGHFYACDEKGFCQDVEQTFVSMPGCLTGMMQYMPQWVGDHPGYHLKTGTYQCTPHEQTRI